LPPANVGCILPFAQLLYKSNAYSAGARHFNDPQYSLVIERNDIDDVTGSVELARNGYLHERQIVFSVNLKEMRIVCKPIAHESFGSVAGSPSSPGIRIHIGRTAYLRFAPSCGAVFHSLSCNESGTN
jgi:hypothetical protein